MTNKNEKKDRRAPDTIKKKNSPEKNKPKKDPPPPKYQRKWGNQYSLKYTEEEIEKLGDRMVDYYKANDKSFYFTDFTSEEMINRQRIYEFEKTNDYFRYCYQIVKGILISRLIKYGLGGKNAIFPIFGLTNIASDEFKNKRDVNVKNFEVDLSKFTEKGLNRIISGDDPAIVILDPESVKISNES